MARPAERSWKSWLKNVPAGLGAPIYGKLDQDIAAALMSINAVKGVEIGAGFASAAFSGEQNADEMRMGPDGKPIFLSNNAGGILRRHLDGAANRCAFCNEANLFHSNPSRTIDGQGKETDIQTKGRHDPCVGIGQCRWGRQWLRLCLPIIFEASRANGPLTIPSNRYCNWRGRSRDLWRGAPGCQPICRMVSSYPIIAPRRRRFQVLAAITVGAFVGMADLAESAPFHNRYSRRMLCLLFPSRSSRTGYRLGANQYGLFIDGFGLIAWRAIKDIRLVIYSVRTLEMEELHIRAQPAREQCPSGRLAPPARMAAFDAPALAMGYDNIVRINLQPFAPPAEEINRTIQRMWKYYR